MLAIAWYIYGYYNNPNPNDRYGYADTDYCTFVGTGSQCRTKITFNKNCEGYIGTYGDSYSINISADEYVLVHGYSYTAYNLYKYKAKVGQEFYTGYNFNLFTCSQLR